MAAGTGRVMADVISGRSPGSTSTGLTIDRYPRRGALAGCSRRAHEPPMEIRSPLAGSVVAITVEAGAQRRARARCWRSSSR